MFWGLLTSCPQHLLLWSLGVTVRMTVVPQRSLLDGLAFLHGSGISWSEINRKF